MATKVVSHLPDDVNCCPDNPISKKVAKILDGKFETDKELIESLTTVSSFFKENTLHNRRNLRRDIESFSLQVNVEFMDHFKKVKEELDKVCGSVAAMNACCTDMTQRLQTTKSQTRDLISQTARLQAASKSVDKKTKVADRFLALFQLTPEELKSLQVASDGIVTKEFFLALNRAKQIHSDCKELLMNGQHTSGLEIMDMMASYQETAYEMLYRWIQSGCQSSAFEKGDINELICQAFAALESRPVLFKYSLDECCNARRNFVAKAFLNALTKGGPSGVPKPIELLSHDPHRYVNDMLAWIHQSLAGEKEFLQCLLKDCSDENTSIYIPNALTQITEGLARPFKSRVEQVMGGENGPVILYKLSNLFRFYHDTMKTALDEQAPLLEVIIDLSDMLVALFRAALVTSLNRILDKFEAPSSDLAPVQGVHQVLLLLREVLEAHDAVLFPALDKKESFNKVFDIVIESLTSTLLLTCTDLNPINLSVYTLNCLNMLCSVLALYQYTEERLEILNAQIDVHIGVLISEQAGYILQRVGLALIYSAFLAHKPNQGPCSQISGLDSTSLKHALDKFELFLGSPDSYKLPQYSLISASKSRQTVDEGTWEAISMAYKLVYDKIFDSQNSYEEPQKIIIRTVDEVKDLLAR